MREPGQGKATLVLGGFPGELWWGQATSLQIRGVVELWSVVRLEDGPAVSAPACDGRLSGLERIYRSLDRLLFGADSLGSGRTALPAVEPDYGEQSGAPALAWDRATALNLPASGRTCFWVEYEGLAMRELETAVRHRLGLPGATLLAQVWALHPAGTPTLAFEGHLSLEHRSLCRSVAACAAKLPALLRGALARTIVGSETRSATSLVVDPPLSASRHLLRLIGALTKRLMWREQWQLELGKSFDGAAHESGTPLAVIRPPVSAFWADPFLLCLGDRTWVLFEELPFASYRGHISVLEIDASGRALGAPRMALSQPWHLSYPFLWRDGARTLMIPESSANRSLDLYECDGEPTGWSHRATLMSGQRWADASVIAHGDRLWLFASHGDEGASMNDALHIYWADRIEGPWHPHNLNPVKIDARSSRPAGAMWVQDGVLHRVVQDCSTTYGGAVRCMRVVQLDEHVFSEEEVPAWAASRAYRTRPWHTFNRANGLTIVDVLVRRPRWRTK